MKFTLMMTGHQMSAMVIATHQRRHHDCCGISCRRSLRLDGCGRSFRWGLGDANIFMWLATKYKTGMWTHVGYIDLIRSVRTEGTPLRLKARTTLIDQAKMPFLPRSIHHSANHTREMGLLPNLTSSVYAAMVRLGPCFRPRFRVRASWPRSAHAPTITEGGTYSGEWQNLDPYVPAVLIDTDEPVVIENAVIRSRGHLIMATDEADVTVRNSRGYGLNPGVEGKAPGRFFTSGRFARVVLENNYLEGTSGIYLQDDQANSVSGQTVEILRNRVKNIDGRHSNGAGGFSRTGYDAAQFVQLNGVRGLQSAEIAWNQIINKPGESRVEDNISVYLSSGVPHHPIRIHDNYIQGAYPTNPTEDRYSGGGIMVGDGSAGSASEVSHHVTAYDNQVIDTTNYGVAIADGHDSSYHHNRVISDGVLDDGTRAAAQNVGIYVWNSSTAPTSSRIALTRTR